MPFSTFFDLSAEAERPVKPEARLTRASGLSVDWGMGTDRMSEQRNRRAWTRAAEIPFPVSVGD